MDPIDLSVIPDISLKDRSCAICHTASPTLIACKHCHLVYYCSPFHQLLDLTHAESDKCDEIGVKRQAYEAAKKKFFASPDPDYRPYYKRQCYAYFFELERFEDTELCQSRHILETMMAVDLDLHHIRKKRKPLIATMGLLIRLGRDQEAFDFHASCHFPDVERPSILHPFNVPSKMTRDDELEYEDRWSFFALVKSRLLLDLFDAQNAVRALQGFLPVEVIYVICQNMRFRTDVFPKRPEL